ncbi:FAD binding domain-containing protein [Marinisporobacter balticus]|uniref:Molybdopterin-dependent oxidoreductase-like protein n=1 Tax=Marinisporobacter balticus TaxID=2018667 RepID=A0A4R2KPE1_9FIRM|nr:FAD binding domain-containing protein [Marinisporobacter balticus]TCO74622.1 molybdopterin-dependent oxidoreductase-like protein [Marinisporobacter balticus]
MNIKEFIMPETLDMAYELIIGVQLRNLVTVGGTVYARYGFLDFITALLALNVSVELYKEGRMSLEEFLQKSVQNDILVKIILYKDDRRAVPNLNGAFKIAVGVRITDLHITPEKVLMGLMKK